MKRFVTFFLLLAMCMSGVMMLPHKTLAAPLSDAESWYAGRTYTLQEYLDLAPRIMVIEEPRFIGKDNRIDTLYVIADGMVTEKKYVIGGYIRRADETAPPGEENRWTSSKGIKMASLGELARMSEEELWEYVGALETVSETPLELHAYTDRSGTWIRGEDISQLLNFGNYLDQPVMAYQNFPIYSKYYIGYAITSPRERSGYFFLSDEDFMLLMDDWNSSGVEVD